MPDEPGRARARALWTFDLFTRERASGERARRKLAAMSPLDLAENNQLADDELPSYPGERERAGEPGLSLASSTAVATALVHALCARGSSPAAWLFFIFRLSNAVRVIVHRARLVWVLFFIFRGVSFGIYATILSVLGLLIIRKILSIAVL